MLIVAFDTATDVATSALLDDGEVLGERTSVAKTLLEDVDALLRQASAHTSDLDALVVGTGPGSFTSTRIGLAVARGLGLALGIEPGETTEDGRVTFLTVECLCACEAAPMAQVDDRYELHLTPEKIDRLLEGLR